MASGMGARSFRPPWNCPLDIPLSAILPLIQVYLPHKVGPWVFPIPIHKALVQSRRCRWLVVGITVGSHSRRGFGYRPLLASALGPGRLVDYGHLWALWSYSSTSITCLGICLLFLASGCAIFQTVECRS